MYVIVCTRHMKQNDYAIRFWGPNSSRYTPNLDEAGRYTKEEIEKYGFFDLTKTDDFAIDVESAYKMAVEREYNYTGWKKCHCILNDEVFYNTFNIKKNSLNKGTSNEKQYWRYCFDPK